MLLKLMFQCLTFGYVEIFVGPLYILLLYTVSKSFVNLYQLVNRFICILYSVNLRGKSTVINSSLVCLIFSVVMS